MTKKIRFVDDPLPIMPDWLIDYPIGAKFGWGLVWQCLNSRVVYYPGSGADFAPMQVDPFAGEADCYIYADYSIELDQLPLVPNCTLIDTQKLSAEELQKSLGLDRITVPQFEHLTWMERDRLDSLFPGPRISGGRWSVLERELLVEGDRTTKRFCLLQIKGEAVWLFLAIWGGLNQGPVPAPLNPTPGLFGLYTAFDGPNWTNWSPGGMLFSTVVNRKAFPLWHRSFRGREWPDYEKIFQDGQGEPVLRRSRDPAKLRPMELFLYARDVIQGGLLAEQEHELAEPGVLPAQKFWFRRYARFLKDTHPTVFEARAIEWHFCFGWLDHFDTLNDDESRWQ